MKEVHLNNYNRKEESKKERRRNIAKDKWEKFKSQTSKNQQPIQISIQARNDKWKAEFLNIIRPLVYRTICNSWKLMQMIVASMFSFGKKSWKAWFISFFVDISSITYAVKSARFTNEMEKDEILRRLQLLLLYALRSPMYQFLFRFFVAFNVYFVETIVYLPQFLPYFGNFHLEQLFQVFSGVFVFTKYS